LMVDSPASTDAAAQTVAPVDPSVKLAPVA
jgi:hypothetical protein